VFSLVQDASDKELVPGVQSARKGRVWTGKIGGSNTEGGMIMYTTQQVVVLLLYFPSG